MEIKIIVIVIVITSTALVHVRLCAKGLLISMSERTKRCSTIKRDMIGCLYILARPYCPTRGVGVLYRCKTNDKGKRSATISDVDKRNSLISYTHYPKDRELVDYSAGIVLEEKGVSVG